MRIEIEIPKTPEMNKYTKRESYFCPGCDTEVTNCNYCPHGQKIDWSKIVKPGDVSDNVCECRQLKDYNSLFKTSCGHIYRMGNNFKFCPHCGKKIKIVGD